MREHVRSFVAAAAETLALAGPVFEFGSYQVEGQQSRGNLRPLFTGRGYLGCDLRPGPGVDRIEDLARLSLSDSVAGTVVCVDTLEHVLEARRAVDEMIRVLAPGGVLLVAVPFAFHIHHHPHDYWRLTPACVSELLAPLAASLVGSQGDESSPHTVYGIGCRAPVPAHFAGAVPRFLAAFEERLQLAAAAVPWSTRAKQMLRGWTASKGESRRQREFFTARFVVDVPPATSAAGSEPASQRAGAAGRSSAPEPPASGLRPHRR